jgi:translation initiation factor 5A
MIKGKPCKVLDVAVSKPGKHGHAKCHFTTIDIFTGKKYDDVIPSAQRAAIPIVNKSVWEVIYIDGDVLTLMDEAGNQKIDLNLPSWPDGMAAEIRKAWNGGESSVAVTVHSAVGIEQVVAYKKE